MSRGKFKKCRARSLPLPAIEELLEMIFLRLPAFDLVRCKQVCKRWRYIISSRRFVSAHLNRSKSDPSSSSHHLLVHNRMFWYLDRPLPGPFKSVICLSSEGMLIVGSVNGLICLAGCKSGSAALRYSLSMSPDDIWILNPVTGLCRKLPPPSKSRITLFTVTVKFAFWWDDDDSGGVYKVAKMVCDPDGTNMLEVWVSSFPDTWTTVNVTNPFYFHFDTPFYSWAHACDVLIEGVAAYWIVANHRGRMFVLSLDLKTLLLKSIPLSKPQMRGDGYLFGGSLNGDFVLLQQQQQRSSSSFGYGMYHVWTMVMDDGNGSGGWKKSYKICFDFPFDKCLGIISGKLVLKTCDNIITLYDLDITQTKEVLEKDSQLNTITMASAHGFVGSLVSIQGFGFEYNDLLSDIIGVSWPSSYPSGRVGKRIRTIDEWIKKNNLEWMNGSKFKKLNGTNSKRSGEI